MAKANVFFRDETGYTVIDMEAEELDDFNAFLKERGKKIINTPTLKMYEANPMDTDAEGTTTIIVQVTEGLLPL